MLLVQDTWLLESVGKCMSILQSFQAGNVVMDEPESLSTWVWFGFDEVLEMALSVVQEKCQLDINPGYFLKLSNSTLAGRALRRSVSWCFEGAPTLLCSTTLIFKCYRSIQFIPFDAELYPTANPSYYLHNTATFSISCQPDANLSMHEINIRSRSGRATLLSVKRRISESDTYYSHLDWIV
ncbi:hypothetical protein C8Q75DRAFT_737052 [Abortiporus biennis]|nr:hypothetical protein C8Q75DRAFT_737052 [Abortiporus biennis]